MSGQLARPSAAGQTSRSLWEQSSREPVFQITDQAQGLLPTWPHRSDGGIVPRDNGQFSAVGGEKQGDAQLVPTRGTPWTSLTSCLLLGYDLIGTYAPGLGTCKAQSEVEPQGTWLQKVINLASCCSAL